MNPAIQCIVLLACISICSSVAIKNCQCTNTSVKAVKTTLIFDVVEFPPRPYCSKHEVILILKDTSKVCLDPKTKFAKAALQASRKMKASRNNRLTSATAASSSSGIKQ